MDFWNDQIMSAFGVPQQPANTAKSTNKPKDDSFQKLLDRQQTQDTAEKPKADGRPETPEASQDKAETQVTETEDPKELEKQMVLAAAAMMQNPVVPVETLTPQEEAQIVRPAEGKPLELVTIPEEVWEAGGQLNGQPFERPILDPDTVLETPEETGEAHPETDALLEETAAPENTEKSAAPETGLDEARTQTEEEAPKETPAEAPVFEDVQAAPIKVGEAPKMEETPEVPVEDQIGSGIAKALETGETRVELQLEPENLGKVTVELTMRENGSLHVAIHAESGRTAGLLEKGLDSLQLMLARSARQEDVHVEVQHQQESQQQDLYDGRQGHPQQGRERQQERRQEEKSGADFLHQLRLGLVSDDEI